MFAKLVLALVSTASLLCAEGTVLSDAERNNATEMNRVAAVPNVRCVVEGGVKVLFIGNSITLHAPAPGIGWTNNWGMAASAEAKDYVHLVTAGIERETGRKADLWVRNLADFERHFETYDLALIDDLVAFRPDYLVVALGENVRALVTEKDKLAYRTAFKELLKRFTYDRMKPNVVVKGSFWPNCERDALMAHAASDLAMTFVPTPCTNGSLKATGLFKHGGVAAHPGDKGMAMMAEKVLEGFFPTSFVAARPVWAKGREREQNLSLRFASSVELTGGEKKVFVRATGCSIYRLRVNGVFAGYGPARGPKGMDRVDEWDVTRYVRAGKNEIEIDVAGYNVANYYLPDQPSYLRAEVVADGRALAATGNGSFRSQALNRVQKLPRYSFQRPFCEVWNVSNLLVGEPLELAMQPVKPLLPRRAAYPDFAVNDRAAKLAEGRARYDAQAKVRSYWPLDVTGPQKDARGFPKEECAIVPSHEAERYVDDPKGAAKTSVWDFGLLDCGFVGVAAKARGKGRVIVVFDEVLTDGKVDFLRGGTANVVIWNIDGPGAFTLESFEPYAFRYAKFIVDGDIELGVPYIRTYKSPSADGVACPTRDPELRKIFEAARETFKQNAVDVFTDCPGRERAGWLCDSYFTARVSKLLTGSLALEELFLENFLHADCPDIPKGMFPMCYPSDQVNRNFIPNWAMWLVLELEEYLGRGGDPALVKRFEPKVLALVDYLKTFENEDGLLENLPKWVFVEWSECNDLTKGVNYPSNMTWSRMLDAVAALYGREDLHAKAAAIRETIRRQSFDGTWFCDQALRGADGKLVVQPKHTETCQYYAFYFGAATFASHPALWKTLVEDFGPERKLKNTHPDVPFSNAFIGNYLRIELLQQAGLDKTVEANVRGYFLPMAEKTGTLWEHDAPTASCCHGFASHVAVVLNRMVLKDKEKDHE